MASAEFDLLRGTLDLLILKAVAGRARHGFGIARWLEAATGGELAIEDGAMYTALHRLEHRGLIRGKWAATANHRRARWYVITPTGRVTLAARTAGWTAYAVAVFRVLKTERRAVRLLEQARAVTPPPKRAPARTPRPRSPR